MQTMCNTSGTYHVQHLLCHAVRRHNSGIKFGRVEIPFTLLNRLKRLTDEKGEETEVTEEKERKSEQSEKIPDDELQKMPHTKTRKFKSQPRLEPTL